MQNMANVVDLFLGAAFTIIMAVVGAIAKIGHERAHGIMPSWEQFAWALPMAVVFGIIARGAEEYFGLSIYVGGALAGAMSFVGPNLLSSAAQIALERFKIGKPPDDDEKAE